MPKKLIISDQAQPELRTDLALNDWGFSVVPQETDDWSIHIPSIECEYDKVYDDDLYTQPAVHPRWFPKARELCECDVDTPPEARW